MTLAKSPLNGFLFKRTYNGNVVEKFRKVSDSVWVSFEAVIIEKTFKDDWTNKK